MSAAVDEDARKKIHEAGGTKSLFEWYTDMDPIVQLEALAALVTEWIVTHLPACGFNPSLLLRKDGRLPCLNR